MTGVLSGMRVVEGSAFVAAPLGGMTLAQLGADVIRFDQIGGGLDYARWPVTQNGNSLYWADLNKGKRSIAVDLRAPEGRELLVELISSPGPDAGLFLTNFPPRGWLSYDYLQRRRPDLIQVTIQGDRHGGTAVDYTVNARLGIPFLTGIAAADDPVNHILPAWDCITGQMAAIGILAAERFRQRTGRGQHIKLALTDVAAAMMGNLAYLSEVVVNDADRARHGNYLFGAFAKDFVTGDGQRIMVVGITRRQWQALCRAAALEDELEALAKQLELDFKKEGDRFRARHEINEIVSHWVRQRTLADVTLVFNEHHVCWAPYQTVRQFVESDPDYSASNPLFDFVSQPGIGTYLAPTSPLRLSAAENLRARAAPRLGQHTDEILGDLLGLNAVEIGRLHDNGIVAGSDA
ncbi:MAG: CoA transferase [Chloroflexi bacterium]|nr:CoA transferase [Chloroflexota bacterium]